MMDDIEFGFSGSGWLMLWQLGVCHALKRHNIGSFHNTRYIGSSGGAACASAMALNMDIHPIVNFMLRCCADYHKNRWRNSFKMRDYAESCFRNCLNEDTTDDETLRNGRLNIVVTLIPSFKHVVMNDFADMEECIVACLASCTATPFGGYPLPLKSKDPKLNGKYAMDGGVANLLPVLSDKTIRITPLYCLDADIKPSRYVPIHWGIFPPSVKEMRELFWLGTKDGMTWLNQQGYSTIKLVKGVPQKSILEVQKPSIESMSLATGATQLRSCDYIFDDASIRRSFQVNFNRISRRHGVPRSLSIKNEKIVRMIINDDEMKAGSGMTQAEESFHKVGDSMTMVFLSASVKPVALGVVYTELASKAALSATTAFYAALEKKRRQLFPQRNGMLSVRRWVHDGMLDSAPEYIESAKGYTLTAINPAGWIGLWKPEIGKKMAPNLFQDMSQKSIAYRQFSKWAIL